MPIPVYIFTGFLEAGKTKFIQESFEDPRFNARIRTLLLVCEEGEEEYDSSTYPIACVYKEVVEDIDDLEPDMLEELVKKYHAKRVVVELNGMCKVPDFYEKMPADWEVAQEIMFADGNTILNYNKNMREVVVDKLTGAEMVVFNRLPLEADTEPLHKLARAVNRRINIYYEFLDGNTVFDNMEDPLPFDINAEIIEIGDADFALFYRDITEEPEKYDKKTVRYKAQVASLQKKKDGYFAPGRFIMTCCVDDITFAGLPCKWAEAEDLEPRSWITVTAKINIQFNDFYPGKGPILTAIDISPADAPEENVCTF